jgi:hypothetical protein
VPVLKILSQKKVLMMMVVGYLLNEKQIRSMMIAESPIIRFTPSAYITNAQIDALIAALDSVLKIILCGDTYSLMRFMVGNRNQEDITKYFETGDPDTWLPASDDVDEMKMDESMFGMEPSLKRFSFEEMTQMMGHFATMDSLND